MDPKTMKVKCAESGASMVINEEDYDPELHELPKGVLAPAKGKGKKVVEETEAPARVRVRAETGAKDSESGVDKK